MRQYLVMLAMVATLLVMAALTPENVNAEEAVVDDPDNVQDVEQEFSVDIDGNNDDVDAATATIGVTAPVPDGHDDDRSNVDDPTTFDSGPDDSTLAAGVAPVMIARVVHWSGEDASLGQAIDYGVHNSAPAFDSPHLSPPTLLHQKYAPAISRSANVMVGG